MKYTKLFALILLASCTFLTCSKDDDNTNPDPGPEPPTGPPAGTSFIESSPQRSGDAQAGYDYLLYGDYVDAGLAYGLYVQINGTDDENLLNRTGDNADINHEYTAVDAFNGVRVVSANCFQCHSQKINGELIVGLGNSMANFTEDQSDALPLVNIGLQLAYGANSPEVEAFEPVGRALEVLGPRIVTEQKASNPAAKLAVVLGAHRDIHDLTWQDVPNYEIPEETIASDVPAWWLLKKKNAMFYGGGGRGDFARIMMASSVLTLQDSTKAREVDNNFADVLAYINSLEPPAYPEAVDNNLADLGEVLFNDNCSGCHGTYGASETYPNLLVELDEIKTDPVLSSGNYTDEVFSDWYNNSWFSLFPAAAQFLPGEGYVAPPLDGVWATAPYLHNGSVPTLADLLDSSKRPEFWERDFGNSNTYDFEKVGWSYEVRQDASSENTFNTNLNAMGNQGHYYGDGFTEEERTQIIEYLKTL